MVVQYDVFSPQAIEQLRSLIGKPLRLERQYNEVAGQDVIRHFAQGCGDDNPLFIDEEHARKTRWGGILAPPTFIFSCLCHVGAAHMGLPGAHALYMSDDIEWFQPIRVSDRIIANERLKDVRPAEGRFAERAYDQFGETTFHNQRGELVAQKVQRVRRFTRMHSEARSKYSSFGKQAYTPEMIRAIHEDYDREERRGAVPRYWEDVAEGDPLGHVVKGPLTVTDIIVYKMGQGTNAFARAHKLRLAYERRHPTSAVPNSLGIPDAPERVHWEDEMAQRVGIPAAFDFGHQRISWIANLLTNWMGDDGFLRRLYVEIRRPNIIADTTWSRGKVTRKYVSEGKHLVDCEVWADNQRGERTARGSATVELPSRS